MLRIVLDTNVLVSSMLAPDGVPGQIRNAWQAGVFSLCLSSVMFEELSQVLSRPVIRKRMRITTGEIREILDLILLTAEFYDHNLKLDPAAALQPGDSNVLATAIAARADLIVSGDGDLLTLNRISGIDIVSPREFIARLHMKS